MPNRLRLIPVLTVLAFLSARSSADPIDFNRDVRPLLSSKCFQCHGPDDKARKAGLRLDLRERATAELKSGDRAIVPGKPAESELLNRITTHDEDDVMPPTKSGPHLSDDNVLTLKRWIEQGAVYSEHWAYVKPVRPALPNVTDSKWPRNEVDRFVLARLEKEKLSPTVEAVRYALIRRVSLDLTGLPPTIAEADAFAADTSPDAYEKIVDRLLASSAYGERWAQVWLDLARYADSQGFANDPDRTIWRWRDWLIQALNTNIPYDQFTVEMIAGDLLPHPTEDQIVATGFNRNTLTNTEGGTNPEEFRSAAVVDRVNTTMQVWTASTFACCQCHNHKYDPFSQKEYYQLYAIFNNTEDANRGDETPVVEVSRIGKEQEFAALRGTYLAEKKKFEKANKEVDAHRAEWEKSVEPDKLPKDIRAIFDKPSKERKKPEQAKLTEYFRSQSNEWKSLETDFKKTETAYKAAAITSPVMKEIAPRESFIHLRGNFEAKGDPVKPALPQAFKVSTESDQINRLTLAQWLISPDHPLTARVAVNRLWEQLFGIGLVETSEDFGTQGEWPSHPELLDFLATEYMRVGWDTKRILRLMVTSATYRQAAVESEAMAGRDPKNRLLARGPRVRLSAEAVRDDALFSAGLLTRKMYGPPCQPPKPNFGLTAAFGATTDWKADTNEERFRRGIYVRVRRNASYPSLTTFDAPERTSCTVRRIATNTPLQALVTLNDPCFIEAAQGLARRIIKEGGDTTDTKVTFAFRTALTRPPYSIEVARLAQLFDSAKANYAADPAKAMKMASDPLGPIPEGASAPDLAAWTVVSNVLLNLDETLARR